MAGELGNARGRLGRRARRWAAVVAGVGVVLVGCSTTTDGAGGPGSTPPGSGTVVPQDEGTPVAGGTLAVGIDAETNGWDPARSNFALGGSIVASSFYDSLMAFDGGRRLAPVLAESVEPNADGTVWTIRIRPGVTFHDGTALDATVVKLNFDKRIASPIASNSIKPIEEVTVVDPGTVEVRMRTPWFGFDAMLAGQVGMMAAASTLQDEDGPKRPVGTGPFRFVSWQPNQSLDVERNTGYWRSSEQGPKPPYLDGIEFRVLTDPASRQTALESGEVQLIFTSAPQTIDTMAGRDGFTTILDRHNLEATAMLNEGKAPFDNDDARRAVALATDREAIVAVMGPDLLEVADGPYREGEEWYVPDTGFPDRDLDAARRAAEAYQAATGSPLAFTLKVTAGDDLQKVAELLQAQWKEAGIEAEIVPIEQSGYIGQVFLGDYQAAMFRNFSWVHPDSIFMFWHSSNAQGVGKVSINVTQTSRADLDAQLEAGRKTPDAAKLKDAYAEAQRIMNDELAYVWLYHQVWAIVAEDRVHGLATPTTGGFARTDPKPWWSEVWLAPAS